MNKNIKRMFFVTTLLILLVSISSLSAADANNDTTSIPQQDVVKEVNVEKVSNTPVTDTNTKNIKKEVKTHIVNNDTVRYVFSKEGKSPYSDYIHGDLLNDSIQEGDILDFQGTITGDYNLTVDKAVNIISSTNDAVINLNTTCNGLVGIDPGNHFIVANQASYTNITGIKFYNTQIFIYNTTHITLDRINATVSGNPVGGGIGQTSIRANSSYITVKNSVFYTENNGGSSTLVLAGAQHCDIINNIIDAGENAGNLFYITTYNLEEGMYEDPDVNSYNNIINNTIGLEGATYGGIKLACVITGHDNYFEGNYIAGSISQQTYSNNSRNAILKNNRINGAIAVTENYTIENNTFKTIAFSGNNHKIINNTIELRIAITKKLLNITFEKNICPEVTIQAPNINITENRITNLNIKNENITVNNCIINGTINLDKTTSKTTINNNTVEGEINIDGNTNKIINNNITNYKSYTITGKGINNTIIENYLKTSNKYGDETVNLNSETNTITKNKPVTELTINTTPFTIGETTNITASIYFDGEIITNINAGKVAFKVNGKTIKDASGKVIYAKVVNGTATIENYIVPEDWAKEGTNIQAIYSGSTQCAKLTSEKTNITITQEELTLTTTATQAAPGQTTTLTATLSDKTINTGKIVFKINGKTVKDANGKVIYAKIVNGTISVNYTLPESYKAGNYTVTATFIASGYDRLETTETLTVTA